MEYILLNSYLNALKLLAPDVKTTRLTYSLACVFLLSRVRLWKMEQKFEPNAGCQNIPTKSKCDRCYSRFFFLTQQLSRFFNCLGKTMLCCTVTVDNWQVDCQLIQCLFVTITGRCTDNLTFTLLILSYSCNCNDVKLSRCLEHNGDLLGQPVIDVW